MKTCEYFQERIVFYDGLSTAERHEVDQHTAECADCRKRLQSVQTIKASLRQLGRTKHYDEEVLTRYGIYLADPQAPDYDGKSLAPAEIAAVQKHTAKCPACQRKVDRVVQEFQEMYSYFAEAGVPATTLGRASFWTATQQSIAKIAERASSFASSISVRMLYPAIAFAAALLLIWISPLFREGGHRYDQLAALEVEQVGFLERDIGAQEMSEGLYAFDQQHYEQAIETLERFLASNPEPHARAQGHFVAGIACLFRAKSDFFGRFQKYDEALLTRGLVHLQAALAYENDLRLTEEANWYLGKAHLMQHQPAEALEAFRKVEAMRGSRYAAAQNMIIEIERIHQSE